MIKQITIGMSFATSLMRNINASDDERVSRLQSMKIEPVADSERENLRRSFRNRRFLNFNGVGSCRNNHRMWYRPERDR